MTSDASDDGPDDVRCAFAAGIRLRQGRLRAAALGMGRVLSLYVFIRASSEPPGASVEILFVKKLALFCIPRVGGYAEKP